jgi:Na+/proline symporter
VRLGLLDSAVVLASIAVTLWIGLRFTRRASRSVDEYFLAGRSLPWWISGTSMVATSFAADTPLVITGWVRDHGLWKNWLWWCYALSGTVAVFLFAPWWRRGGVMTKAELAELRYGGAGARALRGFLGVLHSGVVNTIILCWVLLAAAKILDVLFGVDKVVALAAASAIALFYSIASGLWGVVLTDVLQFALAMAGAIVLGVIAWHAVGGAPAVLAAVPPDALRVLPRPGPGGPLEASFWTAPVAALAAYLGVYWWAVESVDCAGAAVQRIAATRGERDGVLALLWFNVAHYALRPWPWIMVAFASLLLLPTIVIDAPRAGVVREVRADAVVLDSGAVPLVGPAEDWRPRAVVRPGDRVEAGQPLGRTDSERAYIVMMARYLPAGLLGLVAASLLAAFLSTVDTHLNLAASFFVNDVWRRFLRPAGTEEHYVFVGRLATLGVMAASALLAVQAESISALFQFFLSFLGGVGPVYVLRWLWWRVRASTEITALVASAAGTMLLTYGPFGAPNEEARLVLVVALSLGAALLSMVLTRTPDPRSLVPFYERVRPIGWWGPVRALAAPAQVEQRLGRAGAGIAGGLALTFGLLFALGAWLFGNAAAAAGWSALTLAGGGLVAWSLRR